MTVLKFLAVICLSFVGVRAQANICESTDKCPKRSIIETALEQPNVDFFNDLFLNTQFEIDFQPGPEDFDKLLQDISSQGTVIEGIEETFAELLGSFLKSLREGCSIVLGSSIESAITASFDAQFETLVADLLAGGGQVELCPSRSAVKTLTDQALATGTIDVLSIINNNAFTAFDELRGFVSELQTGINTGDVNEVKVIKEQFEEFSDGFIDVLEESCYIPVRNELELLILESFDTTMESFVTQLPPPPDCPNRQAIFANTQLATAPFGLIGLFQYIEFTTFVQDIESINTDIISGSISEMKNIFERVSEAKASFLAILGEDCFISVRDELQLTIDASSFFLGEVLYVNQFIQLGGQPPSECSNRQLILSNLQLSLFLNLNTFLALPEFAKAKEELDKLNEPISEVKVVIEQVNKAREAFDEVLSSNCLINNPNFSSAGYFDPLVDQFCSQL